MNRYRELEDIYDKNVKSKFHLNYFFIYISFLNIKYIIYIYINNNEIQFHEIIKFYEGLFERYVVSI